MLTTRNDISQELKALVDATIDLPRGSVVPHELIDRLTGFLRGTSLRNTIVRKWKRTLSERRGIVVTVSSPPGIGYRLLNTEQQLYDETNKLTDQAVRRINKAAVAVGSIDRSELNDRQRAYQLAKIGHLTELKTLEKKQRSESRTLSSKVYASPRIMSE